MAKNLALLIAVVFLGLTQAAPQAANKTPNDAVKDNGATSFAFGDSVYVIPPFRANNWEEAKYSCKLMGMELVSIETQEEQDAIQEAAQNIGAVLWTSLSELYIEDTYIWESTGRTAEIYSNWLLGYPHPLPKSCVFLAFPNRVWMTADCLVDARYICEKQVLSC